MFRLLTPTLWVLAGIKSYIRYDAVATVLPEGALSKHRGSYILLAPLTALLFEYNLVRSALTRSITWRQIQYRLISPNRRWSIVATPKAEHAYFFRHFSLQCHVRHLFLLG